MRAWVDEIRPWPNGRLLLLDMDGPLAGFDAHGWTMMERLGFEMSVAGEHAQTARYFTDHIVSKKEVAHIRGMIESPGWFEALPVTPGAVGGVAELIDAGVDIWVCTKPLERNPTCRDAKGGWLREHFPMLEDKLIIAPDKSLIHGDILLDDAPKLEWIERATWTPVIFKAAYNDVDSEWGHLLRWTWGDSIGDLL